MMLPPASRLAQKLNPDARALLTDGAGGPSSHQQSVVAQQLNTQNVNNFTTQRSQMAAGIAAQAALANSDGVFGSDKPNSSNQSLL